MIASWSYPGLRSSPTLLQLRSIRFRMLLVQCVRPGASIYCLKTSVPSLTLTSDEVTGVDEPMFKSGVGLLIILQQIGRQKTTTQQPTLLSSAVSQDTPFYHATRMHSADYAVTKCLSVCLYVCHTPVFCQNG